MRWKNKTHGIRAGVRSWSNNRETTGDYLEETSGVFEVLRVNTCTTFRFRPGCCTIPYCSYNSVPYCACFYFYRQQT